MSSSKAELEPDLKYVHAQTIAVRRNTASDRYKRAFDVVFAIVGLIVASPIFLVTAVLIKCSEPKGAILFRQFRIGRDGKPFKMYKFRSMVTDADRMLDKVLHLNEIEGAMFKMKNDPRITPIGRFIRKTSIDELPQFVNVLKGDMSLVGPRPPLPREVENYTPYERQRLKAIPGCTGLWQISGRNKLGFTKMLELDLEYISKQSVWLDFKIMLKTVVVLFGSKDAY